MECAARPGEGTIDGGDCPGGFSGAGSFGDIVIRRVRVEGYKSLANLDVHLSPLTVLIGPNAAGKSNFLDVLQLLSRAATSRTLKEAFEAPYRGTPLESFAFGSEGLPGHLRRDKLSFTIEVDVDLSETTVESVEKQIAEMRSGDGANEVRRSAYIRERSLRYRLTIEILPRSGILRVSDESLAALKGDGEPKTSRNPFLEKKGSRIHLRLEGQAHPTYHEVGLDHTLISRPLYPPHYPHVVALKEELASWSFFYFEPRERMRAANPVKEVRHIGLMGEELAAFLNTLKAIDAPQFSALEKSLRTLIPRVSHIDVEVNAIGEVELRLWEDGMPIPARLVSEGTLRMLGMLAVASSKTSPALVALEEPENGIHPRRIRLIAKFLDSRSSGKGTQFIVTTHSPVLADLIPSESLFVCRRVEGRTEIVPFLDYGPLLRSGAINESLDDPAEKVSKRLLRGDFDG